MIPAPHINEHIKSSLSVAFKTPKPRIAHQLQSPYLILEGKHPIIRKEDFEAANLNDEFGMLRFPFQTFRFCMANGPVAVFGYCEKQATAINAISMRCASAESQLAATTAALAAKDAELLGLREDSRRLDWLQRFLQLGGSSVSASWEPEKKTRADDTPETEWNFPFSIGYQVEVEHRGCYRWQELANGAKGIRPAIDAAIIANDTLRAAALPPVVEQDATGKGDAEIGERFLNETGKLAPWLDDANSHYTREERQAAWDKWAPVQGERKERG